MQANHHAGPTGDDHYRGPYADGNEMGTRGWAAVVARPGAAPNTLVVDLSALQLGERGAAVRAVRYASGSGGFNSSTGEVTGHDRLCCGPTVDVTRAPCPLAACPLKATGLNALPAAPFFAEVQGGRCRCFAPQQCDAAPP